MVTTIPRLHNITVLELRTRHPKFLFQFLRLILTSPWICPPKISSHTAMSRHEMFPGVIWSERGVSGHALDASNFLVVLHTLDVSEVACLGQLPFVR